MTRKFETIDKNAILPKRSTKNAAGYDIYALEETIIQPHTSKLVKTGIKARFPENEVLLIFNRSSNPLKRHLVLANGTGVIDSDYYFSDNQGHIMGQFLNISDEPVTIKAKQAIMQGIFQPFYLTDDDDLTEKATRNGGHGSTDK